MSPLAGARYAIEWKAPPFSPASIPGLWSYLDADTPASIAATGGKVSGWADLSGNGNGVSNATAAEQPTSGVRTVNGRNALRFDGGNKLTSATKIGDLSLPINVAFVVGDENISTNTTYIGFNYATWYGYSATQSWGNFGWAGTINAPGVDTAPYRDAPFLETWRINDTANMVRINGSTPAVPALGVYPSLDYFVVGPVGALGVVCAVVIYEGDPLSNPTNLANLETFLRDRWGTP